MIEPNTCCPAGTYRTSLYHDVLKETAIYDRLRSQVDLVPMPIHSGRTIYDYLTSEYGKHFGKVVLKIS